MPFRILSVSEARAAGGVRMVVTRAIPNPWSEAAKGLLHRRAIPWQGVYLDQRDPEVAAFSGTHNSPALVNDDEPGLSHWLDILTFAEGHGSGAPLLPAEPDARAEVLSLCHLLCEPQGLGWYRRLLTVHRGLNEQPGGFPVPVAQYLGSKYGYQAEEAGDYEDKVVNLLNRLSARLNAQKKAGSPYLVGHSLTAADVYCACFMAYFSPLDESQCAMVPSFRIAFSSLSAAEQQALEPVLLQHRDFIYGQYLELPLTL
ncbi:glutathione S-transferase family protein [Thalassolituus sp. LLYu03]|uniref:glutathione S-transferase family protein n=1 Tax=Thalassolituus sp. LLYu03 TaxID=3421656 RepID=UPI003D29928C